MTEPRPPGAHDALGIAMETAAGESALYHPARQLLARQAVLIDAQVRQLGRQRWRDIVVTLLCLLLLLLLTMFVLSAAGSRAVVVEPIDTAPSLAQRGLTPQVVAGAVQDALAVIQVDGADAALRRNIDNAWTNQITVELPNTGVTIGEVDRLLRARLGNETHVGGAVVVAPDGTLAMTIRATGVPPHIFTGTPADLPTMTTKAAEYVYGLFEPRLYALYLNRNGRYDDTIAFIETAYPRAPEDQRASLVGSWGTAFAQKGMMKEAVAKLRFAVDLDPYAWGTAGNLIGALYDVEGEEGAARAGRDLETRIAAAPTNERPDPTQQPLASYQTLVGDYTSLIDETLAAVAANGGQTTLAANASEGFLLGEAEARRHDWRAATRYLVASGDPALTRATRLLVRGYWLIERGDPAAAITPLEAFDALFRADGDIRYTWPAGPCWLGLAYGLAGRGTEAATVFARAGKWSECYSFMADVAEARGDRTRADALYARAKALTPSLPLPYHRHGLTLMTRGDARGAATQFALAHARGPRWADPLKDWGDVLAAQGQWALAKDKYDAATPLAPGWAALAHARRTATARARTASWWPFD